uniref:RagB/SusD family nutrient uptake outer membrane protein n=1 Tax=Acinetobacter seifertii TaxID=1530123 RepID=UPI00125073EA
VRHLAGLGDISGAITKESLLEEILSENRREFFSERGIRFLDLKRNDKLDFLNVVKPNWKSFHLLWPIPLSELALNQSLNPQNNGY